MHFTRPFIGNPHGSNSSGSDLSAASASNSATRPSPLALAVGQPSVLEHPGDDEDDVAGPDAFPDAEALGSGMDSEGGSQIEIGEEQIDDNPFDPSLSDEQWFEAWQRANARSLVAGRNGTLPQRMMDRVFGTTRSSAPSVSVRRVPSTIVTSSSGGSMGGGPNSPWRMNFRRHRASSTVGAPLSEADEDENNGTAPSQGRGHEGGRRSAVQEPGVVLSVTTPQKFNLVDLSTAQSRSDIVRRLEGFEMSEPNSTGRM